MKYQIFQYPLPAPPELEYLNACLSSHRVVSVQHHVIQQSGGAMLVFVVQTVDGKATAAQNSQSSRTKVDYKQILDEETFTRFSRLREERKKIVNEEGIPLYAAFTNEQLAGMARMHPASLNEWQNIDGIGEAKIKKYGERMLTSINKKNNKS